MCNITLDPGKEFIDTKHGRQFKVRYTTRNSIFFIDVIKNLIQGCVNIYYDY